MNELVPLDQLATEIRYYSQQAAWNIIEVGKRLKEAKSQIGTGEDWVKWLNSNVNYSRSTADRFIQCADRFADCVPVRKLNPTQMIALLSLPADETEEFIASQEAKGKPVEDMAKRALQDEIKKWKNKAEQAETSNAGLQEQVAGLKDTVREQADKLANTGTNSEYLALKEAFDKQAQDLRSAREQADTYQKAWNRERENASKAFEMAQKNVEQSPKYQKLLKENETIKAHIQGKPLEQHAKETNQPELLRSKAEEKKIVDSINNIANAVSVLPANVELKEWAEVFSGDDIGSQLIDITKNQVEKAAEKLKILAECLGSHTGIRRIK
jgi:hypothetical protein